MAKITAADVNKLRKSTGAGMMDCKKALVEAEGDFDKAIAILRKKGQKIAEKRADRDSSEGAVVAKISDNNTRGVVVSLNCETDFVAKNDSFVAMARQMADIALNTNSKEEFLAADYEGMTVAEKLIEQTGVIGEKIEIGGAEVAKSVSMQVASMGATTLSYKDFDPAYVASETEARIAAIEKDNIELGRLGKTLKNVPQYISMSQLTPEVLTKAEDDIKAQLQAEGKPEKIWDKIVPGKIERFISDNTTLDHEQCLLDQRFIMDDNVSVADYVSSKGELSVAAFERVSLA